MKLPVAQIDLGGHLRVSEKPELTKLRVCSIAIDRGSQLTFDDLNRGWGKATFHGTAKILAWEF